MPQLNYGSLSSAMQGSNPQQSSGGSPLSNILGDALNILPFIVPEIGVPARLALGAASTAGSELLKGQPLDAGQIGQGALFGMLPGGGLAKAGEKAAAGAAEEAGAKSAADEVASMYPKPGATQPQTTQAGQSIEDLLNPTSVNPETNQGHVNFAQQGGEVNTTPNTFKPGQAPQETPQPTQQPNFQAPPTQPKAIGTQTSPEDTFTQANATNTPQPGLGERVGNGLTLDALKTQVQQGGSRLTQAQSEQVARNLMNEGYTSLNDAARDAQLTTGENGILSNGVNDHINNAEANGSAVDLRDYNQIAANNIKNGMSSGVLSPAQQKAAIQVTNEVKNILGGPGAKFDVNGELSMEDATHVLPSNVIKTVRELQSRAAKQDLIAQGRGPAADGARQVSQIYKGMANDLMERTFGGAAGNAPISDANLENMINQVKKAPYSNPQYQQGLIAKLESGKGGNMTVQDLRSLQANHVGYANAASPNEISNLTNSLMSAGLGKTGIANAVLNSTPGLEAKAKLGQTIKKVTTPSTGSKTPQVETGGGNNIIGRFKGMSPLAKAATLAGILGIGGIGANAVASSGQNQQAQALLNDPTYQKTQELLNNSNGLQRYLGEQGEIRSIFAPTFDTNAGQAGSTGQTMLQSANQNEAARQAAENLLRSRANMGQGGILGSILSLIPGTSQNAYSQQAANAQAQLNALGIPGSAPGVAGNTSTIPSLTSMSGAVGGF